MEDWFQLNKFVIEDLWMIRYSENVTSFWFQGLHKDLHFSISHRPGDLCWNLHLTKNVPDPKEKPKIGICEIRTDGLMKDYENICKLFVSKILEPISINRIGRKREGFLIKHEDLNNGKNFGRFRKGMKSAFQKCSKRVGKKEFRICKNAEEEMTNWASKRDNKNRILSGLRRISRRFSKKMKVEY